MCTVWELVAALARPWPRTLERGCGCAGSILHILHRHRGAPAGLGQQWCRRAHQDAVPDRGLPCSGRRLSLRARPPHQTCMLYYCRCGKQTLCREETEVRHQSGSGREASWLHRGPTPNIVEAALMLPLAEAPPWPPAGLRALGAG